MSKGPDRSCRVASLVTTVEELERMTPAQRQAHFDASVVTDLSQVRPEFLARVRARLERRTTAQDAAQPSA